MSGPGAWGGAPQGFGNPAPQGGFGAQQAARPVFGGGGFGAGAGGGGIQWGKKGPPQAAPVGFGQAAGAGPQANQQQRPQQQQQQQPVPQQARAGGVLARLGGPPGGRQDQPQQQPPKANSPARNAAAAAGAAMAGLQGRGGPAGRGPGAAGGGWGAGAQRQQKFGPQGGLQQGGRGPGGRQGRGAGAAPAPAAAAGGMAAGQGRGRGRGGQGAGPGGRNPGVPARGGGCVAGGGGRGPGGGSGGIMNRLNFGSRQQQQQGGGAGGPAAEEAPMEEDADMGAEEEGMEQEGEEEYEGDQEWEGEGQGDGEEAEEEEELDEEALAALEARALASQHGFAGAGGAPAAAAAAARSPVAPAAAPKPAPGGGGAVGHLPIVGRLGSPLSTPPPEEPSPAPAVRRAPVRPPTPGGKGDDDILELPLGIEPACDDMCPATEAARRAAEMSLNFFEKNPRNPDDLRLAIKAFNRSSAGKHTGPEDVRTLAALRKVQARLRQVADMTQHPLITRYVFMWDRYRGAGVCITQGRHPDRGATSLQFCIQFQEDVLRFMLYADAFLANDDSLFTAQEQAEAARKKQPKVKIDFEKQLAVTQAREAALEAAGGQRAARAEDEEGEDGAAARAGGAYSSFLAYRELGKAATTLRELYAKAADIQLPTPNEAEVNCYTLIGLAADTHDPCSVQMLLRRLRPEVQESPFIAFACDVVSAVRSNNWHRYFTLLRTAPPLLAVVTAKHAPMMRVQALASMLRAAGVAQKRVPLEYFMRACLFNEEAEAIKTMEAASKAGEDNLQRKEDGYDPLPQLRYDAATGYIEQLDSKRKLDVTGAKPPRYTIGCIVEALEGLKPSSVLSQPSPAPEGYGSPGDPAAAAAWAAQRRQQQQAAAAAPRRLTPVPAPGAGPSSSTGAPVGSSGGAGTTGGVFARLSPTAAPFQPQQQQPAAPQQQWGGSAGAGPSTQPVFGAGAAAAVPSSPAAPVAPRGKRAADSSAASPSTAAAAGAGGASIRAGGFGAAAVAQQQDSPAAAAAKRQRHREPVTAPGGSPAAVPGVTPSTGWTSAGVGAAGHVVVAVPAGAVAIVADSASAAAAQMQLAQLQQQQNHLSQAMAVTAAERQQLQQERAALAQREAQLRQQMEYIASWRQQQELSAQLKAKCVEEGQRLLFGLWQQQAAAAKAARLAREAAEAALAAADAHVGWRRAAVAAGGTGADPAAGSALMVGGGQWGPLAPPVDPLADVSPLPVTSILQQALRHHQGPLLPAANGTQTSGGSTSTSSSFLAPAFKVLVSSGWLEWDAELVPPAFQLAWATWLRGKLTPPGTTLSYPPGTLYAAAAALTAPPAATHAAGEEQQGALGGDSSSRALVLAQQPHLQQQQQRWGPPSPSAAAAGGGGGGRRVWRTAAGDILCLQQGAAPTTSSARSTGSSRSGSTSSRLSVEVVDVSCSHLRSDLTNTTSSSSGSSSDAASGVGAGACGLLLLVPGPDPGEIRGAVARLAALLGALSSAVPVPLAVLACCDPSLQPQLEQAVAAAISSLPAAQAAKISCGAMFCAAGADAGAPLAALTSALQYLAATCPRLPGLVRVPLADLVREHLEAAHAGLAAAGAGGAALGSYVEAQRRCLAAVGQVLEGCLNSSLARWGYPAPNLGGAWGRSSMQQQLEQLHGLLLPPVVPQQAPSLQQYLQWVSAGAVGHSSDGSSAGGGGQLAAMAASVLRDLPALAASCSTSSGGGGTNVRGSWSAHQAGQKQPGGGLAVGAVPTGGSPGVHPAGGASSPGDTPQLVAAAMLQLFRLQLSSLIMSGSVLLPADAAVVGGAAVQEAVARIVAEALQAYPLPAVQGVTASGSPYQALPAAAAAPAAAAPAGGAGGGGRSGAAHEDVLATPGGPRLSGVHTPAPQARQQQQLQQPAQQEPVGSSGEEAIAQTLSVMQKLRLGMPQWLRGRLVGMVGGRQGGGSVQ